jgi:hypothetical protein
MRCFMVGPFDRIGEGPRTGSRKLHDTALKRAVSTPARKGVPGSVQPSHRQSPNGPDSAMFQDCIQFPNDAEAGTECDTDWLYYCCS